MDSFRGYLQNEGKSDNTIKGYVQSVFGFLTWFDQSKGVEFKKLHHDNVREYISFLKTINTKLNALVKFNEFLIESNVEEEMVLTKNDYVKVQEQFASLAKIKLSDVEKFRQLILDSENKRNYALVTLLAYAGLRISEALNLKINDFNVTSSEILVRNGKGSKSRTVFMNDKVKEALQSWLKEHEKQGIENEFVFVVIVINNWIEQPLISYLTITRKSWKRKFLLTTYAISFALMPLTME